jgi:hypothetical protein
MDAVGRSERNEGCKTSFLFHRDGPASPDAAVRIGNVIEVTVVITIIFLGLVQNPVVALQQAKDSSIRLRNGICAFVACVETPTQSCLCMQPRILDSPGHWNVIGSVGKYGAIPSHLFFLPECIGCIGCIDHVPVVVPQMPAEHMWLNGEGVPDLVLQSCDSFGLLCLGRSWSTRSNTQEWKIFPSSHSCDSGA